MGSRYFFILLYCLIERFFSRGDYKKKPGPSNLPAAEIGSPAQPVLQKTELET